MYRSFNTVRMIKSRRIRWVKHITRMEKGRSVFEIITSKPTGKRSLIRPRPRWEVNIRVNLKRICVNTRKWIDATHREYWRALVNAALNLRAP